MALREEVCAQAPGVSPLLGRTGEQWGCRSSTTPSRVSLERENRLLSKGNGSIIAHGWDKKEIPAKVISFWDRHWIDFVVAIVLALVFAVVADLLQVGSKLRGSIRHIKNRLAEQSVKRLQKRIKELADYRDVLTKFSRESNR
jgi:hypothetical protein